MFKKILCPIDFSFGSDRALQLAVHMAKQEGAELVIAHIGGTPWIVPQRYPLPEDLVESLMLEQEAGLAAAAREAARLGATKVSTRLETGVPWQAITHILEQDLQMDLVVVGTHGRSAISRALLGSVAEKVVRHAPCSVLAARPRGDVKAFEHVLCPIDFSDSSRQALETAAELVMPGGAGIALLHSTELPVVYSGEMMPPEFFTDIDVQTRRMLEQWGADLRAKVRVPVTTIVELGSPGARVLDVLDHDPTFDLVVVGSHGRTGIRRVLLGSVAEKIVRHAPCPVLVSRPRRAAPERA